MAEALSGPFLAIDTATRTAVVAVGDGSGAPRSAREWAVGHRHGETLLPAIDAALAAGGVAARDLGGIVVGIGPGSFTGLRVGMTVAKTMAYGLGLPIAGVGTLAALALAAGVDGGVTVVLPAGPSDRYVARYRVGRGGVTEVKAPRIAPPSEEVRPTSGALVAVDVSSAPPEATALGEAAVERLSDALLRLGAERLAAGGDDVAALVPAYATLPRGLTPAVSESGWSPDLR